MLFAYKYINHPVEKFQEYLDFLFYDVWIVAEGEFDIEKLNGNPDLKNIYEVFGNVDYDPTSTKKNQKGKSAYFFNSSIENIYKEFAKIDDDDFKLELIDFYASNNDIDTLCKDKTKVPICYAEIKRKYPDLEKALNAFYSILYGDGSPFNLKIFGYLNRELILSHYKNFIKINNDGICPFCGIFPIDGEHASIRDAYDHFLPKSIYPFNSINFKNLSPICSKCNSSYKNTKDPIEHVKGRKLAFYPYSINHPEINLEFKLITTNVKEITPADYKLSISCSTNKEEIETWNRIFKVGKRYDELICNKHHAKEWFEDIYEYYENAKALIDIEDAEKYYDKVIKATTRNPRLIENTLKRKFLEECKAKGLFNLKE